MSKEWSSSFLLQCMMNILALFSYAFSLLIYIQRLALAVTELSQIEIACIPTKYCSVEGLKYSNTSCQTLKCWKLKL